VIEFKFLQEKFSICNNYNNDYLVGRRISCFQYTFIFILIITLISHDIIYVVNNILWCKHNMIFFTVIGGEKQYDRKCTIAKMNVIELESNGYKMECAIFGLYVDELNSFLASSDVPHLVIIVQLAKVKTFKGKVSLQNAINCTKIIFNPLYAKVVEFKKRIFVVWSWEPLNMFLMGEEWWYIACNYSKHCKVLRLSMNMRLNVATSHEEVDAIK
ncbi:hypothetical protein CR513_24105, partial [Mucuna pruriens]